MGLRVRLTSNPDGDIWLQSPFDRQFVDDFKLALPYGSRSWDAPSKRWLVQALYTEELLRFLQQFGCQVQDEREGQLGQAMAPLPAMPADLKASFDALHLAYTAPLGAAESVFKFFSRHYHPDMGGALEDFQRVNNAIHTIRKYLAPKEADDADVPF